MEETEPTVEETEPAAAEPTELTAETEVVGEILVSEVAAQAAMGSAEVMAAAAVAQGTCGDGLTWILDSDGTMTISGSGSMYNYRSGTAPWYSHMNDIKTLVLEEGITSVGDYAFYLCKNLTELTLVDSLETIGT